MNGFRKHRRFIAGVAFPRQRLLQSEANVTVQIESYSVSALSRNHRRRRTHALIVERRPGNHWVVREGDHWFYDRDGNRGFKPYEDDIGDWRAQFWMKLTEAMAVAKRIAPTLISPEVPS